MLNIAIDGPAGAGKSSVAKAIAADKGILYLDTGALYRAIGLFVISENVDPCDENAVTALLPRIDIKLSFIDGAQHVMLCGKDVTSEIRTQQVAMAASNVSALPPVRSFLLGLQRDIAARNDCVMDGRDIGTVILPNADVKIFLTASPEERARRRINELSEKGIEADFETVVSEIRKRDENDSTRAIAPLKPAEDAHIIDCTEMDLKTVVSVISDIIGELA